MGMFMGKNAGSANDKTHKKFLKLVQQRSMKQMLSHHIAFTISLLPSISLTHSMHCPPSLTPPFPYRCPSRIEAHYRAMSSCCALSLQMMEWFSRRAKRQRPSLSLNLLPHLRLSPLSLSLSVSLSLSLSFFVKVGPMPPAWLFFFRLLGSLLAKDEATHLYVLYVKHYQRWTWWNWCIEALMCLICRLWLCGLTHSCIT